MSASNRQALRLGYALAHPRQICQDVDTLLRFTEFDYDLTNVAFIDYFESRTGVQISWCACGWDHIRMKRHRWTTWDEFTDCRWAQKIAIWRQPDPNDEPWRRILRAQMQDCWELWCEQSGNQALRAYPAPDPEPESEPELPDQAAPDPEPEPAILATAQLELF